MLRPKKGRCDVLINRKSRQRDWKIKGRIQHVVMTVHVTIIIIIIIIFQTGQRNAQSGHCNVDMVVEIADIIFGTHNDWPVLACFTIALLATKPPHLSILTSFFNSVCPSANMLTRSSNSALTCPCSRLREQEEEEEGYYIQGEMRPRTL